MVRGAKQEECRMNCGLFRNGLIPNWKNKCLAQHKSTVPLIRRGKECESEND